MAAIFQVGQELSKHNRRIDTRKQRRRKEKAETPGKDKGPTCTASKAERFYSQYSRAQRTDPNGYAAWCQAMDKLN